MARMLEKELNGLDAEVIKQKWETGLKKAKGNFVCLLEKDSAISPGTIRRNLELFTSRPAYRKLAMVAPAVDFPDVSYPLTWLYRKDSYGRINPLCDDIHAVRIAHAPGAIIRTSSLRKFNHKLNFHPDAFSALLSVFMWENGLRVELNPETLYYAPEKSSFVKSRRIPHPSKELWHIWEREMIS